MLIVIIMLYWWYFQYIFDVTDPEDETMVSIEQWDGRIDRDKGKDNETIGFCVMKVIWSENLNCSSVSNE